MMHPGWLILSCVAAALPAVLVTTNLRRLLRLPSAALRRLPSVSVLIPARNEEANIRQVIESVLSCSGVDLEILIWDDGSTDGTAEIVKALSIRDPRVTLVEGLPLPSGWAGKPFGCWNLGQRAKGDVLLFIDADVRLRAGDSLARISAAFLRPELDLLSGVPWQRVETLWEVMFVPLIHFILLGFLPLRHMRASKDPSFAAGCGQFMAFRREAYLSIGGHSQAKSSFHEGTVMARAIRTAGRVADLSDLSDVSLCRMYANAGEVWRGFAKGAREGLAAPKSILPFSILLFFGQVFPALALLCGGLERTSTLLALLALALGCATRGALALRFKQPISSVLLHPLSVALLLLNQWYGAARYWLRRPIHWRGHAAVLVTFAPLCVLNAAEPSRCPEFTLEDQHSTKHQIRFPHPKPLYLVAASRNGTAHIANWVKPVADAYGEQIDIFGLAAVQGVPTPLRWAVRSLIRDGTNCPVLMDWAGDCIPKLCAPNLSTSIFVIQSDGQILLNLEGPATPNGLANIKSELDRVLSKKPKAR